MISITNKVISATKYLHTFDCNDGVFDRYQPSVEVRIYLKDGREHYLGLSLKSLELHGISEAGVNALVEKILEKGEIDLNLWMRSYDLKESQARYAEIKEQRKINENI